MSNVFNAIASLPGWNMSVLLLLAKATIILIAALGITLAMQRASATARHLVWLVALGTILLVPAMTAWGPIKLAVLPADRSAQPAVPTPADRPATFGTGAADFIASGAPSVPAPSRTDAVASPGVMNRITTTIDSMSGVSIVLTIWGAVALVILATLAMATLNVRRIVRRSRPLTSPDWEGPLYEIADRLGLEDAPRLLQSDDAKMPFACGVLRGTIVLPAESENWTLDRRRAVLLHELAHVRRHDLLGHTLGRLACAAYWFHPLVWTAARQLRSESERACDDLALSCGTRATDYAEHLLDIVTSVRGENTPLVALAMARRKEFEGRMLAILDPHLRHSAPSRRESAVLIAALALVALTVGAVSPVARVADAAMVSQSRTAAIPPAQPAPVFTPSDAPHGAPMKKVAYPDSGVRGEERTVMRTDEHVSTSYSTATSTAMSSSMSAPVSTQISTQQSSATHPAGMPKDRDLDRLATAAANAGVNLGVNLSANVLEALGANFGGKDAKGAKGAKGAKSDDERATLLAKILRSDSSASLRRIAAWGLHEYAEDRVAEDALVSAVRHDADARVREMSAWSLVEGNSRSSAASDAMIAALKSDASERVRATAAWGLATLDVKGAVDVLTSALGDQNRDVRLKAAWAIGELEPKQAPRALVALLNDAEPRVRELASWALFQIEDPSTVGALESALKKEQDPRVQVAEIRALATLGEKSVDALRTLLESKDQTVRSMAVKALAGGNAAGPWPWPWPDPRPFP